MSYWADPEFKEKMLAFLCRDRNFLKRTSSLLEVKDFKPRRGESQEQEWIAEAALTYWKDYGEPIGGMLKPLMQDFAREKKINQRLKDRLMDLTDRIRKGEGLVAVEAIEKLIVEYKNRQSMRDFLDKLITYQEEGKLSEERVLRESYELTRKLGKSQKVTDYGWTLKKRILRREKEKLRKFPFLLIEPLDVHIKTIPRGTLALIIAKYARGKSMALAHIARAMALQGYNVLFFTLEDPQETVEDRLDAMMTGIPTRELGERPVSLKKKFRRVQDFLRGRIKIYDGTDGGMSVDKMEEIWERLRNQGFVADVVIIDYDDEIIPPKKYGEERRLEFADIYRQLRVFASRRQIYLWTAAQTKRGHEQQMVVGGDEIAEDISKIRKVAFCLGIGAGPGPDSIWGDWGPNGRYIYVAKHKWDKMKIGWPIMGDFDSGLFYDSEATSRKMSEFEQARKKVKK